MRRHCGTNGKPLATVLADKTVPTAQHSRRVRSTTSSAVGGTILDVENKDMDGGGRGMAVGNSGMWWGSRRRAVTAAFALVSASALALVVAGGAQTARTLAHFGEDDSPQSSGPYADIASSSSSAVAWLTAFLQDPDGGGGWQHVAQADASKAADPLGSGCRSLGNTPESVLMFGETRGQGVVVRASVYSPGYARGDYERMRGVYDSCDPSPTGEHAGSDGTRTAVYQSGALMTAGDVVVGVSSEPGGSVPDALVGSLEERLAATLKERGCAFLSVSADDGGRNPWGGGDYSGLTLSEAVRSSIVPLNSSDARLLPLTDAVLSEPEPEGPLPAGFPAAPQASERPSDPTPLEGTGSAVEQVDYKAADDSGPGCGWQWIGFDVPQIDRDAVEAERDSKIAAAQARVDAESTGYYRARSASAWEQLSSTPVRVAWNDYAAQASQVDAARRELRRGRAGFKPLWDSYVMSHDAWVDAVQERERAKGDYERSVLQCMAGQGSAPASSPSPSTTRAPSAPASPSPSPSPQRGRTRAECEALVPRPSSLNGPEPVEPSAPQIPEGITVPSSWAQPKALPLASPSTGASAPSS